VRDFVWIARACEMLNAVPRGGIRCVAHDDVMRHQNLANQRTSMLFRARR